MNAVNAFQSADLVSEQNSELVYYLALLRMSRHWHGQDEVFTVPPNSIWTSAKSTHILMGLSTGVHWSPVNSNSYLEIVNTKYCGKFSKKKYVKHFHRTLNMIKLY